MTYSALYQRADAVRVAGACHLDRVRSVGDEQRLHRPACRTPSTPPARSGINGYVPARQYWFRGKVTGAVDYIFGDAAAVFDHTSIYTEYHGTATGSETIEAQKQADADRSDARST